MSQATDSIHMVIDSFGYAMLIYAEWIRAKEKQQGLGRSAFSIKAEKWAVGFSLVSLLVMTVYFSWESIHRIKFPEKHAEKLNGGIVLVMSLVKPVYFRGPHFIIFFLFAQGGALCGLAVCVRLSLEWF